MEHQVQKDGKRGGRGRGGNNRRAKPNNNNIQQQQPHYGAHNTLQTQDNLFTFSPFSYFHYSLILFYSLLWLLPIFLLPTFSSYFNSFFLKFKVDKSDEKNLTQKVPQGWWWCSLLRVFFLISTLGMSLHLILQIALQTVRRCVFTRGSKFEPWFHPRTLFWNKKKCPKIISVASF